MIRITAKITGSQSDRLRKLSREQSRPMSWYVWRGLQRHVLPVYGDELAACRGAWNDGGASYSCSYTLPDEMGPALAAFELASGRGVSWAVRAALEEYVFPTYDQREDAALCGEMR